MITELTIEEFLLQSKNNLTLDVRSEGEFNYGRIPHATNLPLFNNEERKTVGTIYKQQNREEAILAGLDIAGKKMSGFIRFAQEKTQIKKVFIHCWRGGMRSGSMAWLFNQFGFEVFVLKRGYKSYRQHVHGVLSKKFNLLVIGGKTGSGKTELLRELKKLGEQVINLEALANHKGSAFGALGMPPQPSTEHFENLLAEELKLLDEKKIIWLEDESKNIGKVFINENFWSTLRQSPLFVIDLPQEIRVKRLVKDYGENMEAGLEQSIRNIEKRLGNENCKNAIEALQQKNFSETARITLNYYDKAYEQGITMKNTKEIFRLAFGKDDLKTMAEKLLQEAGKNNYGRN